MLNIKGKYKQQKMEKDIKDIYISPSQSGHEHYEGPT